MKKIFFVVGLLIITYATLNAQKEVSVVQKSNNIVNNPMIVVDGIQSSTAKMEDFNPNQIEAVNVLKGTAATTKYGTKGANGVVEITTKKKEKTEKSKGTKNKYETITDTTVVENQDTLITKKEKLSILIDGDKIIINGKPATKDDPRLQMMGKHKMMQFEKGKTNQKNLFVDDITEETESDDFLDKLNVPAPPTNKAFLGVLTEEHEKGAKINMISEGSPAEKAGLQKEDIIRKVNEKNIDGPKSLYEAIGAYKPEEKVTISYIRTGKEQKVTISLAKNKAILEPKSFSFSFPNGQMPYKFQMPNLDALNEGFNKKPKLGISVEDIESGEGVKIKNITNGSIAEKAGFNINDIIIQLADNKVSTVNDLKWNYLQEGQVLNFTILRNGEKMKIEVKIPKKLRSADL